MSDTNVVPNISSEIVPPISSSGINKQPDSFGPSSKDVTTSSLKNEPGTFPHRAIPSAGERMKRSSDADAVVEAMKRSGIKVELDLRGNIKKFLLPKEIEGLLNNDLQIARDKVEELEKELSKIRIEKAERELALEEKIKAIESGMAATEKINAELNQQLSIIKGEKVEDLIKKEGDISAEEMIAKFEQEAALENEAENAKLLKKQQALEDLKKELAKAEEEMAKEQATKEFTDNLAGLIKKVGEKDLPAANKALEELKSKIKKQSTKVEKTEVSFSEEVSEGRPLRPRHKTSKHLRLVGGTDVKTTQITSTTKTEEPVVTDSTPEETPKEIISETEAKQEEVQTSIIEPTIPEPKQEEVSAVIEEPKTPTTETPAPEITESNLVEPNTTEVVNENIVPADSLETQATSTETAPVEEQPVEETSPVVVTENLTPETPAIEISPVVKEIPEVPTENIINQETTRTTTLSSVESASNTENQESKNISKTPEDKDKAIADLHGLLIKAMCNDIGSYNVCDPTNPKYLEKILGTTPASPNKNWKGEMPEEIKQILSDFSSLNEKDFISKYVKSEDADFSEKALTNLCSYIFGSTEPKEKSLLGGLFGSAKNPSTDAKGVDHRAEIAKLLESLSKVDEKAVSVMSKELASKVEDIYSRPNTTVGEYLAHVKLNIAKADSSNPVETPENVDEFYKQTVEDFNLGKLPEKDQKEMMLHISKAIQKQFLIDLYDSLGQEKFDALQTSVNMGTEYYITTLKHVAPDYNEIAKAAKQKVMTAFRGGK